MNKQVFVDYGGIARPDGPVGIIGSGEDGAELLLAGAEYDYMPAKEYERHHALYDILARCGIEFLFDGMETSRWYPAPGLHIRARDSAGGVYGAPLTGPEEALYFVGPSGAVWYLADGLRELLAFLAFERELPPLPEELTLRFPLPVEARLLAEALKLEQRSSWSRPPFPLRSGCGPLRSSGYLPRSNRRSRNCRLLNRTRHGGGNNRYSRGSI